ncbi:hypothetical protein [Kibdelosporangium persicum]|uniref:hypothetical protein n=1 Tax=Kibdelosporangium persicum TaxID=2698649 RepID=UPI00156340CA|nr:hypothetical protein [Kibdelosporangium persicum]
MPNLISYPKNGPLTKTTPLQRVLALAETANVDVFDLANGAPTEVSALVTVSQDPDDLAATVGLAPDLTEDLRTDVIAFVIALVVGTPQTITNTPQATVAISRTPLEPAADGPGHLARHMLYTCGRTTPSATFAIAAV